MTTPKSIDYNGIQINSQDTFTNIVATAISTLEGVKLNYDLNTTPKSFTINNNGFTLAPNTSSFDLVCKLQQLLASVIVPPNATTLAITDRIQLQNGTDNAYIHNTGGNLIINDVGGHSVVFNQVPSSFAGVSGNNDITKKSYVDANYASKTRVVDFNTSTTNYVLWGAGAGSTANQLYTGTTIGDNAWNYNPNNGGMGQQKLYFVGGSNTRCVIGATASGSVMARTGANSVFIGDNVANTGDIASPQPQQCAIIGYNSGTNNLPTATIAIGNNSAVNFSNPGGLATTASLNTISLGYGTNQTNPTARSISIGYEAGKYRAGPQTNNALHSEVLIGYQAGWTGEGLNTFSASIGYKANYRGRPASSVVINATGNELNAVQQSTYIAPLKTYPGITGSTGQLFYDFDGSFTGVTGQIFYSSI